MDVVGDCGVKWFIGDGVDDDDGSLFGLGGAWGGGLGVAEVAGASVGEGDTA